MLTDRDAHSRKHISTPLFFLLVFCAVIAWKGGPMIMLIGLLTELAGHLAIVVGSRVES